MELWKPGEGIVEFPSGRRVRGRSWKTKVSQDASLSVVLTTAVGKAFSNHGVLLTAQETVMIDWPDYRLPRRPSQAARILHDAWERAAHERVEITCGGGVGRTGTALAILALYEGMDAEEAVEFVRRNYHPDAVLSHAQSGFLRGFTYYRESLDCGS